MYFFVIFLAIPSYNIPARKNSLYKQCKQYLVSLVNMTISPLVINSQKNMYKKMCYVF